MAYTTIDDGSAYFQTALYTGNGNNGKVITINSANFTDEYVGADMKPDWIWGKCLNLSQNHNIFDTSRGLDKRLTADQGDAENTDSTTITAVATNSFTLGSSTNLNNADDSFVCWLWKANGGTTSSDSNGSITSTVQVESTAKFSIVTYTGVGATRTVGHGLGVKPSWIVLKNRNKSAGEGWVVYHGKNTSQPETDGLHLNLNNATNDSTDFFSDQAPTTTTFGVSGDDRSGGSFNYVAYCFAEIQGYCKFGTYTGNGNADGPFVYTGFSPAWIISKRTDASDNWRIVDKARNPFNDLSANALQSNNNNTETDSGARDLDFLSNGFKVRTTDPDSNANGGTYIYSAFAEHPFSSSEGVSVTAK